MSPSVRPPLPLVLVVVGLGGAAGAVLRWAAVLAVSSPWTTAAVNVSGAALLALLPAWARVRRAPLLPPALGTGLLGGWTTMSGASEDAVALLDSGDGALAAAYVLGTLGAALAAVALVDRFVAEPVRREFEAEEGDR